MLVSCIMVRSSQIQERAVRGEISWTGSTLVRRPRALPMTRQVRGGGPAVASGITEDNRSQAPGRRTTPLRRIWRVRASGELAAVYENASALLGAALVARSIAI